jgi:hypothetical protein
MDVMLTSRPGRFTPDENSPQYPNIKKMGGPQSQSGRFGQDINFPSLKSNHDSSVAQPVLQSI